MTDEKTILSADDYIKALEKMKNSPRDRIGILGELGATGLGGLAGIGIAASAASAAGVATIAGSTTLGTILGGVFITSTPVGWVVGSIMLGGAIGYGASKLVKSGAKSDQVKQMNINELSERLKELNIQANTTNKINDKMCKFIEGLQILVENNKITQNESTELIASIERGSIEIDAAFKNIQKC